MVQQTTDMKRDLLPGRILLVFAALMLLAAVGYSWSMPLVDSYGFRQAQTAWTIQWIARGYPVLSYITPVLGSPWSIPFEFPLFQWLAALLSTSTGMTVDQSGRLLSTAFHIASVWMLHRTVLALRNDRVLAICIAGTYAISPFALFWGRSVMIESTAVFFGLVFVWAMVRLQRGSSAYVGLLAVIAAILSAQVKITTFFAFASFVALGFAWHAVREQGWRPQWWAANARLIGWGLASAVAVVVLMKLWLLHADALKAQTPSGAQLTSGAMESWNYGTIKQRLDAAMWWNTFAKRRFAGVFGSNWVFIVLVGIGLGVRRIRPAVLLLLLAYVVPFLAFTNLHFVHDYYQSANILFATTIGGVVLWWLITRAAGKPGRKGGIVLALLLCALSARYMAVHYLPGMRQAFQPTPTSVIATFARTHTAPDSVMVVFGLDWSSELPFFADRRAVMVPDWAPPSTMKSLADSNALLGGAPLGMLVDCPNQISIDPSRAVDYGRIVAKFSAGAELHEIQGCQVWLPSHPAERGR